MQTYKISLQCTTISADKNKILSARQTYFTTFCKVLTHPESKQKQFITSILMFNLFKSDLFQIRTETTLKLHYLLISTAKIKYF